MLRGTGTTLGVLPASHPQDETRVPPSEGTKSLCLPWSQQPLQFQPGGRVVGKCLVGKALGCWLTAAEDETGVVRWLRRPMASGLAQQ